MLKHPPRKEIIGGYSPVGSPEPSERDDAYTTILSGDIDHTESEAGNALHILTADAVDSTASVFGFYIAYGNANEAPNHGGGALICRNSASPKLQDCTFLGNSATFGAAIYNESSSPRRTNCSFQGNVATSGGGIANVASSTPALINCILWNTDLDGDGNSYGVEMALGTYPATPDASDALSLTSPVINASGHVSLSFGRNPNAPSGIVWILTR